MKALFAAYDSDSNFQLDLEEVLQGLVSCGVLINRRQTHHLVALMDTNGDGMVSFGELVHRLAEIQEERGLVAKQVGGSVGGR